VSRYRYWVYSGTLLRMDPDAAWFPQGACLGRDGRWRPDESPDRNHWRGSDCGDEVSEQEAEDVVAKLGLAAGTLTDPRLAPSPLWPQAPTRIGVTFERRSVAMGDDSWAPHTWTFEIDTLTMLGELARIAIDGHYLASISGGQASWVLQTARGGRPLAVVAQQWQVPRWLADPADYVIRIRDVYAADRAEARLYFEYRVQADPGALFEKLLAEHDAHEYDNTFAPSRRDQPERPSAPW
jgi:hypothetical protein